MSAAEGSFHRELARHRGRPLPWRVLRARPRLLTAVCVGVVVGLLTPADWRIVTRALTGWDAATVVYLALAAAMIGRTNVAAIRHRAMMLDDGRVIALALTSLAAVVAIGAIVAELGPMRQMHAAERAWGLALAFGTILASWFFIHFEFALHYAHEFYLERRDAGATAPRAGASDMRGGLSFPNTAEPAYIDFLYFAYTIGVAAQTADVSVCSRPMRIAALAHSVLTFFFNTTILALTINIAAGLF